MSPMSTVLKSILILSCLNLILAGYPNRLTFNPDGNFTILQFTDLHYGEGEELDLNNTIFQDLFIANVKPDMVAMTGDLSSGYAYTNQTNFTANNWKKFWLSIEKYQVPYTFAMGNHDPQGDINADQIYELEMQSNYSLCDANNNGSFENFTYYVPIYSSIVKDKVSVIIWHFDSHSNVCEGVENSWGCVGYNQIQWYYNKVAEVKALYGDDVYHFAIVHIPLTEYTTLYNDYSFYGSKNEDVCCPAVNTMLFQAIRRGGIQAIYCGHDHDNDYAGYVEGVELVYGRKSGYGGYGGSDPLRGAKIITLSETQDASGKISVTRSHYTQVENDDITGLVTDNSTLQEKMANRTGVPQLSCSNPDDSDSGPETIEEYVINGDNNLVEKIAIAAGVVIALAIVGAIFWAVYKKRSTEELRKPLQEVIATGNYVSYSSR